MKVVIVGPGIMPIPPTGWGAVESLIWDYKLELEKRGVTVRIVNTPNPQEIIRLVNAEQANVVHIQYDNHYPIVPHLHCKNIVLTSHYGYLDSLEQRPADHYWHIFRGFIQSPGYIQALSPSIRDMYVKHGADPRRVAVVHNGANHHLFRYTDTPQHPHRSIYLAKIDYRKRQYLYQDIMCVDFAGNLADNRFNARRRNYLGEWSKTVLYQHLTDYANLVLLSDGEAHPLVCCEAMVAGLGLVVSRYAAANLDTSLHWIDVIPDDKLEDIAYVIHVIKQNQERSLVYRKEIREYALQHFTWERVVERYLEQLAEWFSTTV
jgi:glycosyltransferase involved in cell wall biosynthesis